MSNKNHVYACPDDRAVCGEGLLIVETVGSNPAFGMDICNVSVYVMLT